MSEERMPLRDVLTGVLVLVVGAAVVAFANIPSRVSVVESSQAKIERSIERMDAKLDTLIERQVRR